jgi:hypothetical protein
MLLIEWSLLARFLLVLRITAERRTRLAPLLPFQARVAADHAKRAPALQPGHSGLLV